MPTSEQCKDCKASFVDRKDFSWFQFHVFTFATVELEQQEAKLRSRLLSMRGIPFRLARSSRIRGWISCV